MEETTMKYAMISQPMRGKTEDEIRETRESATAILRGMGYHVLDNTGGSLEPIEVEYADGINIPLSCLSDSLATMAKCDAVLFCDGWQNARGCRIEHAAAVDYGLKTLYGRQPKKVTIETVENGEKKERVLFETEHAGVSYTGYSDNGIPVKR